MKYLFIIVLSIISLSTQAKPSYQVWGYSDHYTSLTDLRNDATLVIRGLVVEKMEARVVTPVYENEPVNPHRLPLITPYRIKVRKVIKGEAGEFVRVLLSGGENAEYSFDVNGAPLLEEGQGVVLFLVPFVNAAGKITDLFTPIGLDDGVLLADDNDQDSYLTILTGSDSGINLEGAPSVSDIDGVQP